MKQIDDPSSPANEFFEMNVRTGSPVMSELILAHDWSANPLGPKHTWPPALRTALEMALANRFPMIFWWGPERIQFYNDPYCAILGAKHPAALGQRCEDCWPEIWPTIGPMIHDIFAGGPSAWYEDLPLALRRHGFLEETYFTFSYSPLPDPASPNGIGGILCTVHETTDKVIGERHVALLRDLTAPRPSTATVEDECRSAAETLARYPESVPFSALYLVDETRTVARLAGVSGTPFDSPAAPAAIDLHGASRSIWPLPDTDRGDEIVVVDGLGERLAEVPPGPWPEAPHRAAIVPIRSSASLEPAGYLVAGINAREAFDARYRTFFGLVGTQISAAISRARTHEEERRRLEALAEIDRAKTAFFSNVSHEFRTPLTLMLGPLEELAGSARAEDAPLVGLAHRNALRLLKLVNTLLEFSRLEAGRSDAEYVPTDLAAATRDLCSLFRSGVEGAGLAFSFDTDLDRPAYVDRAMWEKIVLNLLSNALKFTFAGGVRVALHDRGDAAELTVSDSGVGIAPEELPHLFERFHRVRGAKSRSHEGSGIGLALVDELVRLHGGSIDVESEPGRGTTFRVRVPFGFRHLDPAKVVTAAAASERASVVDQYLADVDATITRAGGGAGVATLAPVAAGGRILIADDNGDLREYVTRILSARYDVIAVRNGLEALEAARTGAFDLVVTDAMMPEMDGFALLARLRADPHLDQIPVIMLSARAGEEAAIEGLARGADDYLSKPFSAEELLARVSAHLGAAAIRERATRDLRASEERFRNLTVSMPHIVVESDRDGAVTFVSDTYERYTARPAASALGGGWAAVIHPEDLDLLADGLRDAVAAGSAFGAEFRMLRHDGVYRWHVVDIRPQRDPHGAVLRYTGTIADVDDRIRAVAERQLLADAGRILAQSLDVATTLENLARLTIPQFADWCQIALRMPDGRIRTVTLAHRDPAKQRLARGIVDRVVLDPDAPSGSPHVIRTGRSELIEDVAATVTRTVVDPELIGVFEELGMRSAAFVPLTVRGETLGAIAVVYGDSGRRYAPDDLPLLEELGRRAGLAVHNASLFEREHRVAASFQEASLPQSLPDVRGIAFDAVYVPASDEAQVGGDWYDAMRLVDGRVVISIGDVTGHGLDAAVTMGNIRQIVRGIAQVYADPAFMLDAADRALRLEHPDQIVTAFVGVLDPIAGTLAYASAGHPPPMLRRPDGSVELLADTGMPLGLWENRDRASGRTVRVPRGSHVVLYTDGLTEFARDPVEGEARLMRLVAQGDAFSSQHPASALKVAVLDGAPAKDDVAILVTYFDAERGESGDERVQRWSFDVADAEAGQAARRAFGARLRALGATADRVHGAEVVFGELVGNAARHAPGEVEILVDWSGRDPILHVLDRGPGFQHMPVLPSDVFSESGRGLFIVSHLSELFYVSKIPGGGSHARAVLSLGR